MVKREEEINRLLQEEKVEKEEFPLQYFIKDLEIIREKVLGEIEQQKREQKLIYNLDREKTKEEKFKYVKVEYPERREKEWFYSP